MSLLDKLKWRYATKKMDPSKEVPAEKVDAILEAIRLPIINLKLPTALI